MIFAQLCPWHTETALWHLTLLCDVVGKLNNEKTLTFSDRIRM